MRKVDIFEYSIDIMFFFQTKISPYIASILPKVLYCNKIYTATVTNKCSRCERNQIKSVCCIWQDFQKNNHRRYYIKVHVNIVSISRLHLVSVASRRYMNTSLSLYQAGFELSEMATCLLWSSRFVISRRQSPSR